MMRRDVTEGDGAGQMEACNVIHLDDQTFSGLWHSIAVVLARATMRLFITHTIARSDHSDSEAA
jgi:hypothetical protein